MNPDSGRANRRILIVDDTASIHEDFRKILCANPNDAPSLDSLKKPCSAPRRRCARRFCWIRPIRARRPLPW